MNSEGSVARRALRRMRIYRGWWIVAICFAIQFFAVSASGYVFGVLLQPMEASLGWSRSQLVGAITVVNVIGGVVSAGLGPVVDRYGTRRLMTVSLLVAAVALMSFGLVTALWQYYVIWICFGLAIPGLRNLGPRVVVANWFVRRRALALMIVTMGTSLSGVFLVPVMARVATTWGWQSAWLLMGCVTALLAPLVWISVRRQPEDVGLLPDGARPRPSDADNSDAGGSGSSAYVVDEPIWTVRQALHTRTYWLVSIGLTLTSLPGSTIFIHIAPYITSRGFTLEEGGGMVSVYGAGALLGRPIWGTVIGLVGVYRTLIMFAVVYGVAVAFLLIPDRLSGFYAAFFFLGIAIGASNQLNSQVLPDYYGRRIVGALTGYFSLIHVFSGAFAPLYAAVIYDVTESYTVAFGTFSAACFLGALMFALAKRPEPPAVAAS